MSKSKIDSLEALVAQAIEEATPKPTPDEKQELLQALEPLKEELAELEERLKAAKRAVEVAQTVEERVRAGVEATAIEGLIARCSSRIEPLADRLQEIEAREQRERLEAEHAALWEARRKIEAEAKKLVESLEEHFRTVAREWAKLSRQLSESEYQRERVMNKLGWGAFHPRRVNAATDGLASYPWRFGGDLRLTHGGDVLAEILRRYLEP
ncbi:hypothetical protein [Meiothermus cerbereus]|uniref:hypothetical protein n=1 Tax=Meiothermus cerbereus TaxID=65552 RepID=UPI003EE83A5A